MKAALCSLSLLFSLSLIVFAPPANAMSKGRLSPKFIGKFHLVAPAAGQPGFSECHEQLEIDVISKDEISICHFNPWDCLTLKAGTLDYASGPYRDRYETRINKKGNQISKVSTHWDHCGILPRKCLGRVDETETWSLGSEGKTLAYDKSIDGIADAPVLTHCAYERD